MRTKVITLAAFSVAMGFLEAVVVVYLRQLYYPEGFSFPLRAMAPVAFSLESLREGSTIVMFVCVGVMAGRNTSERLAWGLYCFGIWDVFYYVWLKVLLNWPLSWMTWDILFLIPIVWSGPVVAPIICALTMLAISAVILVNQKKGRPADMAMSDWILLALGSVIIVCAFVWEYAKLIVHGGFLSRLPSLVRDPGFQQAIARHVPDAFNWSLFIFGEVLVLLYVILFWIRSKNLTSTSFDKGPR